jgi:hypothetical protein
MAKMSDEPLQPNPFITYRDPKTGLWLVIPETVSREKENNLPLANHNPSKHFLLTLEIVINS